MLTLPQVGALLVLSFFDSAFTAGFGIGGGIAVITVMVQILPPAIVLPLHGVIQTGSNAGRVWAFREHVDRAIVGWFAAGSVLGVPPGGDRQRGQITLTTHPSTHSAPNRNP